MSCYLIDSIEENLDPLSFTESASADLHKQAINSLVDENILDYTFRTTKLLGRRNSTSNKSVKMISFRHKVSINELKTTLTEYCEYLA